MYVCVCFNNGRLNNWYSFPWYSVIVILIVALKCFFCVAVKILKRKQKLSKKSLEGENIIKDIRNLYRLKAENIAIKDIRNTFGLKNKFKELKV